MRAATLHRRFERIITEGEEVCIDGKGAECFLQRGSLAYTNVGCEGAVVHIPMPLKALENGGARCVVSALELQDTIQCFLRGTAA